MVEQIINWVNEIIESNIDLIALAGKRRSKFEGWLKFELARKAFQEGATSICIEGSNENFRRCDLSFTFNNIPYFMELKTPNTSLQINGIENLQRPTTRNRAGIVADVIKIRENQISNGIILFILFPLPVDNNEWGKIFIENISRDILQTIDYNESCERKTINANGLNFDILICCFKVVQNVA